MMTRDKTKNVLFALVLIALGVVLVYKLVGLENQVSKPVPIFKGPTGAPYIKGPIGPPPGKE